MMTPLTQEPHDFSRGSMSGLERESGMTYQTLAEKYHISKVEVGQIIHRRVWRHVV